MTVIEARLGGTRIQASTWEGSVMKIKSSRSELVTVVQACHHSSSEGRDEED
jgi:hypothetical protein